MGILVILLGVLIPALSSLSKSNSRKAAISNLLGAIEQARATAIKDGVSTYIVFPTFVTGTQATLDRYNYRSYAVFEDDAGGSTTTKQVSNWKVLPTGVALRAKAGSGNAVTSLAQVAVLPQPTPAFSFTPDSSSTPTYYLIKFNAVGEVEAPAANLTLGVFEGFVNTNGSETPTGNKDGNGNPLASEYLAIAQHTGRAAPTTTPTATP